MNESHDAVSQQLGELAEEARALMTATSEVAGEKVGEARKRLASALESAKEFGSRVRDQAVAGAKVADQTVRENPYQAIIIGVGVGALAGYLLARSSRCNRD